MRKTLIIGSILLAGFTGTSLAACPDQATLSASNLLGGRTICASPGTSFGGLTDSSWNEQHNGSTSGSLVELHGGMDGSENVGTWSANGNQVTYNYAGGSGDGTYDIYHSSGCVVGGPCTLSFCQGTTQIASGVYSGQSGCP